MEFRPNKKQVFLIISSVIIIVLCGTVLILKSDFQLSNKITALSSSGVIVIPSIVTLAYEMKSFICVNDEFLHYNRSGKNVKVRWSDIGRIEYSNPVKVKCFDCMIVYSSQGLLYIDYTIKNYMKLWRIIVMNYSKYGDEPNIDCKLLERIK